MKLSRLGSLSLPIVFILANSLSGCGLGPAELTEITYRQIGLCKAYGAIKARTDEAFAIFEIVAIDNTKTEKNFYFDPSYLYVDQSTPEQKAQTAPHWDRRFANTDASLAESLGVPRAAAVHVPKASTQEIKALLGVTVATNNPTRGPEDKQYSFELAYDSGSFGDWKVSKGMTFTRTNAADTKWSVVDNCQSLSPK